MDAVTGPVPSHGSSRIVHESGSDSAADLIKALDLSSPRPVIIVSGAAAELESAVKPRLRHLFTRGVARAAAQVGALIVDGGTHCGVMEIMGAAVAELGHRSPLLGVAPAARVEEGGSASGDRVPLDANHSHLLLTLGEDWGDEAEAMFAVAAAVADGAGVVLVVAGGGARTLNEVLRGVRQRWPVILLEGSGGLADQIAGLTRTLPPDVTDAALLEIVRDGELIVMSLAGSPDALAERILRVTEPDVTLRSAWERFAVLDLNANLQQRRFSWLQASVLILGLAGATIAVVKSVLKDPVLDGSGVERALYYAVLGIPIVVSVAIAGGNRFKPGSKWLLMRAAAESVKREIFRYRTRSGDYRHADRDGVLALRIEDVTRRLAFTEVNTLAFTPYLGMIPPMAGMVDDGLSSLSPERYLTVRVADQLRYYRKSALRLHRKLVVWQVTILGLGGLGTLLAAIDQSVWVAVTTAAVTTATTHLGYRQVEASLTTYNQTATDLENVRGWWHALSPEEQANPANLDKLVDHAEKVMASELDGWVQKMQNALDTLRKDQEEAAKKPR
jgi:SLOG in TRPM, prokaryote/SMODS and SLOG-associating 2TM effector domain 1/Protein of unknown function (DUF4231)